MIKVEFDFNLFEQVLNIEEINKVKKFYAIATEQLDDDDDLFVEFIDSCCSISGFGGLDISYENTPPELFPFAAMGVDGSMYGYLVLAPELEIKSSLIYSFCPMDSDGISLDADNFLDFIAYQMSCNYYEFGFSDIGIPEKYINNIKNAFRKIKIKIPSRKLLKKYDLHEDIDYNSYYNNSDYKYIPTSDGVGVFTLEEKYDLSLSHNIKEYNYDNYYASYENTFKNGYYGSSLFYLKEIFWNESMDKETFIKISDKLISVYNKLDRKIIADAVDKNKSNYTEFDD